MLVIKHAKHSAARSREWNKLLTTAGHAVFANALRSADTIRYTKETTERILLEDALAPFEIIPEEIKHLKPQGGPTPDFELQFGDGKIFCECTAAGDPQSFNWELTIGDWERRLSQEFDRRPDVLARLGNRYLAFVPMMVPLVSEIESLVLNAVAYVENEEFGSFGEQHYGTRVSDKYPALSKLNTVIASSSAAEPHVFIQMPATSGGGPIESLRQLERAFQRKAALRYNDYEPVWLIIGASRIMWPLDEVINAFIASRTFVEPFQKIYVSTPRESFRIEWTT